LATHTLERPKEDEDDVRDVRAIEMALANLGDYNLETSEQYEVRAMIAC
jgi:hypothetical protein